MYTETSSLRTLKMMPRNLNEIVRSWIRLQDETLLHLWLEEYVAVRVNGLMISQHKTLAIGKTGDVVHCHFNIADNDHAHVLYLVQYVMHCTRTLSLHNAKCTCNPASTRQHQQLMLQTQKRPVDFFTARPTLLSYTHRVGGEKALLSAAVWNLQKIPQAETTAA